MTDQSNSQKKTDFLNERYSRITPLASGGMGDVYRAYDKNLAIDVAIKMVGKPTSQGVVRFQQEARAYSKLVHPNLVKVFDFGVDPASRPYLVMEYITGISLKDLIKIEHDEQLCERDDKYWLLLFKQICAAMEHAHRNGVIHRDLKPSNVLVTAFDTTMPQAKIIDFGLAKITEENPPESGMLTAPSNIVGSPLYLSPEQARSEKADERSDIYSFGCLMYECLSGRPPFRGETALDTISMHITELPVALQEYNETVLEQLEALVHKCLEKDPQDRFQSMKELSLALDSASDALSGPAPDLVPAERKIRRLKTLPLIVSSLAMLILIITSVAAINRINEDTAAAKKNLRLKKTIKQIDRKFTTHVSNGIEFIEPVRDAKITDEDLKQLHKTTASVLDLSSLQITGSGLKYLGNTNLTSIDLSYTLVDDDNVANLISNKGLIELGLEKTKVTLAGLKKLAPLKNIQQLHVSYMPVGDETVDFIIKTWPNLQILTIGSSKITQKGIARIADKFPNLNTLAMSDCKLKDKDLIPLASTNIKQLHLNENYITDKSLDLMLKMPSLSVITIHECHSVSDEAIRHFQKVRPGCHLASDLAARASYRSPEFESMYNEKP